MGELLLIALGAALVNNFVLVQLLGVCPFIGGTQRVDGAIALGFAMALVLTASVVLVLLQHHLGSRELYWDRIAPRGTCPIAS